MTSYADESESSASSVTPFESIPELVSNPEFANRMELARQTKAELDKLEALYKELQTEVGAMIAVAGQTSVAYLDLVVTNVSGGEIKGKLTGAGLIDQLDAAGLTDYTKVFAIARAAKDCDPKILIDNAFPASLIEPARDSPKPRAGSTQFKWVGGSGRGGKKRAAGGGGPVQ